MDDQKNGILLYAGGEVCINRENPHSIVEQIVPHFRKADIKFFQLETVFSERGAPVGTGIINLRAHPRNVSALKDMGFDVASFASNHTMDGGDEGLFDTIEILRQNGIQTVGVGVNLEEARRPAIVQRNGTRVGFLGYNSHLPAEYWATDHRPGCVPLSAFTVYQPKMIFIPGSPAWVHTYLDRADVEAMCRDIVEAKTAAELVVVSMHWGPLSPPEALDEYEIDAGHMAIDAGADMILGTGAHEIKPIEVYKGKVIFHGLGNLAFDFGRKIGIDMDMIVPNWKDIQATLGWDIEPEWMDNYVFSPHARKGIVGKCIIAGNEITEVSFLPLVIDKFANPRILSQKDKEFDEVFNYVVELCKAAKMNTLLIPRGDEVVIQT